MTKRIFLLLVLVVSATIAGNAQKIAITKGQKLETVTNTKSNMEVMGQNIDNENTLTSSIEVKDVTADGFLFANTTKRMTMKGSMMGQDINFDSDKKEDMDGQIGQALKDQIGSTQEILVDKKGKISDVKTTGDAKPAGGMGDVMNMSGSLMKGQAYPILIQLPSSALKAGSSWTDSTGTVATLKTVTTYTLKGITEDGALVSFTGTMAKNGTITQNGMEMQMDMTGNVKGDAIYEVATGLLKKNNSAIDLKGTLGVMGQNAPISATVVVTTTAKKI